MELWEIAPTIAALRKHITLTRQTKTQPARLLITDKMETQKLEPWLRGTLNNVPPIQRAVLHGLELAKEDVQRWCGKLSEDPLKAGLGGIAPLAFHIRHIARSMDRLLTYADGKSLRAEQIGATKAELNPGARREDLFAELSAALQFSAERIRTFSVGDFDLPRSIGRQQMPTTVGGILVHGPIILNATSGRPLRPRRS